MFKSKVALTGAQIQHLIDRFSLRIEEDELGQYLRRANRKTLKVETVEKMLGINDSGFTQNENWVKI